jgi:membrane protease YdiL (CAAX protease family)
MGEFLRRLSPKVEFAVVILAAFGMLIAASIGAALHHAEAAPHTDQSLIRLAGYESVLIVLLGFFLAARGWTLERIGLTSRLSDTGFGLALFATAYCINIAVWSTVVALAPQIAKDAAATVVVSQGISQSAALLVAFVNPVFEEVFVCGYVIAALKRDGDPWLAINVSVAIRLSYHLYQGALGVISVIPMGLLFAYWFARTGRLWPLIIAHTVFDLIALLLAART